jgi:hypothetical protein
MEKVYLVYYDNGQQWEDNSVTVMRVFASKENAELYVEEHNSLIRNYVPSVTKEEYIQKGYAEETHYTYEQFIDMEHYDWMMDSSANYFVREEIVHP